MKMGAHEWPNKHPKACHEWDTEAGIREERERFDENLIDERDND